MKNTSIKLRGTLVALLAVLSLFLVLPVSAAYAAEEESVGEELFDAAEEISEEAALLEAEPSEETPSETEALESTDPTEEESELSAEESAAAEIVEDEASSEYVEAEPQETEVIETEAEEAAAVVESSSEEELLPDPTPAEEFEEPALDGKSVGYDFPTDGNGSRYYIAPGTTYRHTGWLHLGDYWYYFYQDGTLATGWIKTESGYTYYFEEDSGIMHKGWANRDGVLYYMRPEDGRIQSDWRKIDGSWYYFGEDGRTRTGWAKSAGGYWYYFDPDTGAMQTGWQTRDGGLYYMRPGDGRAQSDWRKIDGSWYYFGEDGRTRTGWAKSAGGYWYYFDPDTGAMQTGWQTRDGNTYYMRPGDGRAQSDWRKIGDYWYFFGNDGRMRTGWVCTDGKKYYMFRDGDGLGGATGANASNIMVDGFYVNQYGYTTDEWTVSDAMLRFADDLESQSKYLIMVDRWNCCMGIFEGSRNNWSRITYEDCSPGAVATPTPRGTYSIMYQGEYFDSYGSRCWYYSYFANYGYCLHSVLYNTSGSIIDGRLGKNLSHGCVRMSTDTAYWIYNNCPVGTTVFVY